MVGVAGWDDVTMLAVGTSAGSIPGQPDGWGLKARRRLENEPTAPGVARRFVRQELTSWDVADELVERATLCVSELATNAVVHGGSTLEVTVELDDGVVTVLVTDSGGNNAVRRVPGEDPELVSGRGLALVEGLSSSWGSEQGAQGTTVWFELDAAEDEDTSRTDEVRPLPQ